MGLTKLNFQMQLLEINKQDKKSFVESKNSVSFGKTLKVTLLIDHLNLFMSEAKNLTQYLGMSKRRKEEATNLYIKCLLFSEIMIQLFV
jgi:hypothetical protein